MQFKSSEAAMEVIASTEFGQAMVDGGDGEDDSGLRWSILLG